MKIKVSLTKGIDMFIAKLMTNSKVAAYVSSEAKAARVRVQIKAMFGMFVLLVISTFTLHVWGERTLAIKDLNHNKEVQLSLEHLEVQYNNAISKQSLNKELVAQVKEKRLNEDDWARVTVNIDGIELDRSKVQQQLASVRNSEKTLFRVEQFEIRTKKRSDGIFDWNEGDSEDVILTLKGDYFRRVH